jgi:hypothetical protein
MSGVVGDVPGRNRRRVVSVESGANCYLTLDFRRGRLRVFLRNSAGSRCGGRDRN